MIDALCNHETEFDFILQQRGVTITPELLLHLAPWGWEHINLLGRYHFDRPGWPLEQLRPFR